MRSEAHRRVWSQAPPMDRAEHKLGTWIIRVREPSGRERIEYIHIRGKHKCPIKSVIDVVHYGHLMAVICEMQTGVYEPAYLSYGKGSVSDQQMMNVMFEELRIPLYFSRNSKNYGFIHHDWVVPQYG